MALQRYDIPFVGVRTNHSEVCVLFDIQRRNQMVSGRAWNINTGFSTPFLDVDYRLKFRHLIRVHFSPDGTACGFEAVYHPNWKVYEGRIDSEMEKVKMIGVLNILTNYHEDGMGKLFNSPVGTIRINPKLCAEAGNNRLRKVKISFLPRPENFQGKHVFWEVTGFMDGERFGKPRINFPASSMARDPLLRQVGRMNHLLQFGHPLVAHIKNQARYMPDNWYKKVGVFVENCEDLLTEIPFAACRDEAKELIMDSIETQNLGVEIFVNLLINCFKSLNPRDIHDFEAYIEMRKENAAEWNTFVRYG